MKIAHISVSAPFIDGWGYQENLLPKYLQKAGVQNFIVASSTSFPSYLKKEVIDEIKTKGNRYNLDGVEIRRIPTRKVSTSLFIPKGLKKELEDINPDVIFHHNFNNTSLSISALYAKKRGIPLIVDNHADYINMTKNKVWAWFYYKFLIGMTCKTHQDQIYKAYGVTHSRCKFIHEYYGLTEKKIDFLPIGADVDTADTISPIVELRQKYGVNNNSFVVVTGGKNGKDKGTDNLIKAIEELHSSHPQLKLILFGKFEDEETATLAKNSITTTIYGWCDRVKTLELLKIADVACWPIHHTTLIEDAVSVCTPLINKKTSTTEHLIDGNGIWIKQGTKEEIKDALAQLLSMTELQKKDLCLACEKMKRKISYYTVAKKILDDISQFKR